MTDEREPSPRRRGRMIDNDHEQEEPPYFEADFNRDETVPTGDAWDMFHSYLEIGAIQTLDLGALLMSAVTLRHAFEYLNHDPVFVCLAQNANGTQAKVEEWLRAECQVRLGAEVNWFEQLREVANFTKHGKLTLPTSVFGGPRRAVNGVGAARWRG